MIYLDNAATTEPKYQVVKAICDTMKYAWYNPSAAYKPSVKIRQKIEEARQIIASSIGAKNIFDIYFTSGGSESNSWALQGFHKEYPNSKIIISCIEHNSIMSCAKDITDPIIIGVDKGGMIELNQLESALKNNSSKDNPALVSIQFVNNELGVIQDIKQIAEIAHKYNAFLHTDAVQAYPHISINVQELGIDMMSVSAHKFGCPKGIGFLYKRYGFSFAPLIYGSQEKFMRGGTENTPYIIGMSTAVPLRELNNNKTLELREIFENRLELVGGSVNCKRSNRIDNIISCTLPERSSVGELVMYLLSFKGIIVSTGSACNSHIDKPSYVLKSIGLTDDEITRTIRISLPDTDDISINKIDEFTESLQQIIG